MKLIENLPDKRKCIEIKSVGVMVSKNFKSYKTYIHLSFNKKAQEFYLDLINSTYMVQILVQSKNFQWLFCGSMAIFNLRIVCSPLH